MSLFDQVKGAYTTTVLTLFNKEQDDGLKELQDYNAYLLEEFNSYQLMTQIASDATVGSASSLFILNGCSQSVADDIEMSVERHFKETLGIGFDVKVYIGQIVSVNVSGWE